MRDLAILILWCVLAYAFSQFGHWTLGFVVAFLVIPVFKINRTKSIIYGFISVGLVWLIAALLINSANQGTLATMIGNLLGGISPSLLLLATGLIGGFGGLLGGWLAYELAPAEKKQ
jgi:hypothetical protein